MTLTSGQHKAATCTKLALGYFLNYWCTIKLFNFFIQRKFFFLYCDSKINDINIILLEVSPLELRDLKAPM